MNCATHNDVGAVAYCRTCGKPLCANCSRSVQGVIYCETCLADRLHGTQPQTPPPAAGFAPSAAPAYSPNTGPNPALAGILSGVFPFGVGAVYNGQYAKGLSHLGIFVLLIVLESSNVPWFMHMFFGISIGFFYVYQIIDAVRTARALQTGQPAPDPFGLAQTFGTGTKTDVSSIPLGAVILIGLGVLFLLQNLVDFEFGHLWPLILIALGLWLAVKRSSATGESLMRTNPRFLMGPAVLVTLGTLFLLGEMHGPDFGHTWPILLLVIGLIRLLGGARPEQPAPPPAAGPVQGEVQPPENEVKNG
ncbi:MAG TPA: DUF5668 domain-containing protein [Terriglobales bacterium]|jgi:hypothetical protein